MKVGTLFITKPDRYYPGSLCRVLSETAKRVKVEVLVSGVSYNNRGPHVNGGYAGETPYVNKDDIWKLDVTQEQYDSYRAAYARRDEVIAQAQRDAQEVYDVRVKNIFPE